MRARAAALFIASVLALGCSGGSLAVPATTSIADTTTSTTSNTSTTVARSTTTVAPTTALPLPTRPATTTTSTSLDIPAGASAIVVASAGEVAAVIGKGAWDYSLPVPQAGLAQASWTADDDRGGTLVLAMPAVADDTAGFFRLQLNQHGFQFTEARASNSSSFYLGEQGTVVVTLTSATTCSVTITMHL